ncbi:hypothetical protein TNCT_277162 [Trichonephila clavata]|uniref:Uncharacterized protein n=1 Tax=Trichonephila clavata TaxID=2740835 RepID=A0A8X6JP43_TRICU|nr:hypothetical protein TNCT_277162 [Trichonephila clavata]
MAPLNMTILVDLASEFSEELEVLRLPLEKIPLSQRQLQLSQWIHYILMSNNIRVNIRLAAIIQKNVDKLSPPNNMEKEVKHWLDALKPPPRKIHLVTESYLLLLFMLHLRFLYEKFPVKMFEIKFIAFHAFIQGDECMERSRKRFYYFAIVGISAMVMGGCVCKILSN